MNHSYFKSRFNEIHFILLVFFLIQCIGITNPPLEIGHNWRQTITAMIARNLPEYNFNVLYPRVDFTGNNSGISGSEFPFFQAIIAFFQYCFGYSHWYGRLINLLISTWGAWNLYNIVKTAFNKRLAINTTVIFLFSVWFSFSRKIMPDTFSIALMLLGARQLQLYWYRTHGINLIFAFLGISLSILCKLPAIAWLATLVFLITQKTPSSLHKKQFHASLAVFLTSVLATLPGLLWYFYWVPKLNVHFQLFYPKQLLEGFREILPHWSLLLEKFYFTAFYSFTALLLFCLGIIFLIQSRTYRFNQFKYVLVAFLCTFFLFILKTGDVFPKHTYYIIPFVPFMSFIAALGIEFIRKKIVTKAHSKSRKWLSILPSFLVLIAASEAFLNQIHELSIKPTELYKLELEKIGTHLPKDASVISNAGVNPQELYFLNKKGWVIFPSQIEDLTVLDSLKLQKAHFLVINKNIQGNQPKLPYKSTYESKNFKVYDLESENH